MKASRRTSCRPRSVTGLRALRFASAAALVLCATAAAAQTPPAPSFSEAFKKQEGIYHDKAQEFVEGYVTDRNLADYVSALASGFDQSLTKLGPQDRWLDIGAGMGQAILDYYSAPYDATHIENGKPNSRKARAVAMSIEDRHTAFWDQTAARLAPGKIQYLADRRLSEYSPQELGQFQLVTDVVGGFSYTANLSLFMEKVLGLLTNGGVFYTVLQDVRVESGDNKPYYAGSPFLTVVHDATGADIGVCAWLKQIGCAKVTCEAKSDWQPPVEVYRVEKICNDVTVPPLEAVHFDAGTPPERGFRLATPPDASAEPTRASR